MTSNSSRTNGLRSWEICVATVAVVFLMVSCSSVPITESFRGKVVDADTGVPLSHVAIQVVVMRTSTYDGVSLFAQYACATSERGEFVLPRRKKFVDSVAEREEEIHYEEMIVFGKIGYEKKEYRSDDENGLFSRMNADRQRIVVRMKKLDPQSVK